MADEESAADDFNPRPRTEGDEISKATNETIEISIHALARRATVPEEQLPDLSGISIHALARRATTDKILRFIYWMISIHALARRATKQFTGCFKRP